MLDPFTSMLKTAEYFNVDYRSILNHLDTKLASIKGGKLVLFFSHELTKHQKESLLNNIEKVVNVTVSLACARVANFVGTKRLMITLY